jgi:hypothetical protein
MMPPEEIAEARRLFYGEHWKVGTIVAHLHRHPDAIKRAIGADNTLGCRRPRCRGARRGIEGRYRGGAFS